MPVSRISDDFEIGNFIVSVEGNTNNQDRHPEVTATKRYLYFIFGYCLKEIFLAKMRTSITTLPKQQLVTSLTLEYQCSN